MKILFDNYWFKVFLTILATAIWFGLSFVIARYCIAGKNMDGLFMQTAIVMFGLSLFYFGGIQGIWWDDFGRKTKRKGKEIANG